MTGDTDQDASQPGVAGFLGEQAIHPDYCRARRHISRHERMRTNCRAIPHVHVAKHNGRCTKSHSRANCRMTFGARCRLARGSECHLRHSRESRTMRRWRVAEPLRARSGFDAVIRAVRTACSMYTSSPMQAVSPMTTPLAWSIMRALPMDAAGWMSTPRTCETRDCRKRAPPTQAGPPRIQSTWATRWAARACGTRPNGGRQQQSSLAE
mmetsp:Transcript_760/g.2240  ORF Transcript_760/g.2240 Transcript_760/m.2240 type:complete len:210 (+) Transcript_760:131-760(+)